MVLGLVSSKKSYPKEKYCVWWFGAYALILASVDMVVAMISQRKSIYFIIWDIVSFLKKLYTSEHQKIFYFWISDMAFICRRDLDIHGWLLVCTVKVLGQWSRPWWEWSHRFISIYFFQSIEKSYTNYNKSNGDKQEKWCKNKSRRYITILTLGRITVLDS